MTPRLLPACLLACCLAPPALGHVVPSPLLYVRFAGPEGTRATFYQGRAAPRAFNAPVVVGMRPGYCYRMKLDNLPDLPGVALYPTLEVRGSLWVSPKLRPDDLPSDN